MIQFCTTSFHGLKNICLKNHFLQTRNVASNKVYVYAVGFFLAAAVIILFAAKTLYGRISKKQQSSTLDDKIADKAQDSIHPVKSQTHSSQKVETEEPVNKVKKQKLSGDKDVAKERSIDLAMKLMIERSVGRSQTDDYERACTIMRIPNLADKIASTDFLISFGERLFAEEKDKKEMMKVLKQSVADPKFCSDLKDAVKKLRQAVSHYYDHKDVKGGLNATLILDAESGLRDVLTVFTQARNLKPYHRITIRMECCEVKNEETEVDNRETEVDPAETDGEGGSVASEKNKEEPYLYLAGSLKSELLKGIDLKDRKEKVEEIDRVLFSPYFLNDPYLYTILLIMAGTSSGVSVYLRMQLVVELHGEFTNYLIVGKKLESLIDHLYSGDADQTYRQEAKAWLKGCRGEFDQLGNALKTVVRLQEEKPSTHLERLTNLDQRFQSFLMLFLDCEIRREAELPNGPSGRKILDVGKAFIIVEASKNQ